MSASRWLHDRQSEIGPFEDRYEIGVREVILVPIGRDRVSRLPLPCQGGSLPGR